MNKHEKLGQISELIDLQEKAIHNHPPATYSVYCKGRDAFIQGQETAAETEWSRAMSLSLDELSFIHRYMLSSSFISAWYHLRGDKANRDKAAQSCSLLIGSLTSNPEQVMLRYIKYEQLWRQTIKKEGIAPRRVPVLAITLAMIVLVWMLKTLFGK